MPIDRRALLRTLAGSAVLWSVPGLKDLGARPWRPITDTAAPDAPQWHRGLRGEAAAAAARATTTEPVRAERPFGLVGVAAPPDAEVEVRVSGDGWAFGPWRRVPLRDAAVEGPDGPEAAAAHPEGRAGRLSAPVWTGVGSWLQLRVAGAEGDEVEAVTVPVRPSRSTAPATLVPTSTAAGSWAGRGRLLDEPDLLTPAVGGLQIVTRAQWEADESLRKGEPSYAERVLHGVVHHTAGSNDYTREEAPRIVESIYRFHTEVRGWNDIGYNLLVDRFGGVYEGRYGGLDLPVIGAHAKGANTGSFGVAVLGDFRDHVLPWAAREALFEVLAAKFDLHAVDPDATVTTADGREVATLAGHLDVGSTECPGHEIQRHLPTWRDGLRSRVRLVPTDIDGHSHEANIRSLRAAGVTAGYPDGTFRPDEPVTRAQMATFLTRAAQLPPGDEPSDDTSGDDASGDESSGGSAGFADVSATHPHRRGILAVAAARIAEGYDDGTFRPSNDVTRGQMASFLARALDLPPRPSGSSFSDVSKDHTHHATIEAVAEEGIARGYGDGTFRPGLAVTRGQMASFLVRAFELPPAGDGPQDPEDLDEDAGEEEGDHADGDGDADGEQDPDADGLDSAGTTSV